MASQAERKAVTRRRLLEAAADLFASKGVHAVSLDAVADAAGRTTGAIYAHFGGKAGLLLALLDETSRQVGRETRDALTAAGHLDERVGSLWSTFAERAEAPDDPWMLLEHELWLHAVRTPEVREQLADRFRDARQLMGASFAQWLKTEGSASTDVEELAALVLALLYGLDMQRRVDPSAVSDDVAVRGLLRLFDTDVPTPPPSTVGSPADRPRPESDHAHAD